MPPQDAFLVGISGPPPMAFPQPTPSMHSVIQPFLPPPPSVQGSNYFSPNIENAIAPSRFPSFRPGALEGSPHYKRRRSRPSRSPALETSVNMSNEGYDDTPGLENVDESFASGQLFCEDSLLASEAVFNRQTNRCPLPKPRNIARFPELYPSRHRSALLTRSVKSRSTLARMRSVSAPSDGSSTYADISALILRNAHTLALGAPSASPGRII